jgi:hypothetical protein
LKNFDFKYQGPFLEQFNREPKGPLNGNATFKPTTKEDDNNKMSIHGIIFMNSL